MLILLLDSYNGFIALTVLIEWNSRFLRMIFFFMQCALQFHHFSASEVTTIWRYTNVYIIIIIIIRNILQ